MALLSRNGNGGVILPSTPKVIHGRSLAHRQLNKRQRAILAADVIDGLTRVAPTQRQVADLLGVSLAYVLIALRLSLEKCSAILCGSDPTSFAELNCKIGTFTVKAINTDISDAALLTAIRQIGIDRVLTAAVVAEAAD